MNTVMVAYLALVVLMVLAFVLKSQVQRWMVVFARIMLVLSLVGALIGVFAIGPFITLAERSLENAGTLETLRKIDTALPISKVVTPVKNLVDQIKELWNGQKDIRENKDNSTNGAVLSESGLLEQELYPSLVAVVAKLYKGSAMVISLFGLILSVYMNYSVAGISDIESLRRKYSQLEKKMEVLHGKET